MPRICNVKHIEDLIPTKENKFYMSNMTRVPTSVLDKKRIYAFVVDEENGEIVDHYRVEFVLFTCESNNYLFISNFNADLTSSTPYLFCKTTDGGCAKKEDWDFRVDDISLYAITGSRIKRKIYFTTSYNDYNVINDSIPKKKKVTMIASPVYI